jgi:hypothetical protein
LARRQGGVGRDVFSRARDTNKSDGSGSARELLKHYRDDLAYYNLFVRQQFCRRTDKEQLELSAVEQ